MRDYTWPGPFTPFRHQPITSQFIVDNPRCFVLNEMGLGKSASALWAADYLMQRGDMRRVLVVSPLSTLNRVWVDEVFKLLMHRRATSFYGTAERRRTLFASPDWEIGITNFDGVAILHNQIARNITAGRLDAIIIDEASAYRNSRNQRWRLMKVLADRVPRLVLMTGTPCPESPLDAYGLAKLLGVPQTPRYFGTWRDMVMQRVNKYKWVPKPDGYETAFQLLQPAIRFTKADCLDLPPLVTEDRTVELSAEQRKIYRQMQREMVVKFADDAHPLTAVSAADKLGKLRQIACGVVKDTGTGEYLLLDHAPRLSVLRDVIQEATSKVLVVVPFKGIIKALEQELSSRYSVATINGDVPASERDRLITRFKTTSDPHVLLVHPKVMAHGLTLTEASTLVFYGPIYSGEETKQIIERINRPGQKQSMTVVRMAATDLEWRIYSLADKKMKLENEMLDMYNAAMCEAV